MVEWNPGRNPFPQGAIKKITNFEYLDELKLVRHARVHVNKTPKSLWQLSSNFRARMEVYPKDGASYPLTIRAPRGLTTDLSSVPRLFWSFVGPIGPHLEISIIHDYLYMAWTDFRADARRDDWDFAHEVFRVGLRVSKVPNRGIIHGAVHSILTGWPVFRSKSYTLKERMEEWLPLLAAAHGR